MIRKLLRERLDALDIKIDFFEKKYKGSDYSIVFIIVATGEYDFVEVRGPGYLRKTNEVEFAVHIPYKEISDFTAKIAYVLSQLAEGMISVFKRYEADYSGLIETVQDVVRTIHSDPKFFQYQVSGDC
jgi:hypothetical protein